MMRHFLRGLFVLLALVGTARAGDPPVPPPTPVLQAPVANACISSPFGPRHGIGFLPAGMHNGLDLPAPAGAAVHAVATGRVIGVHRRGLGGLEVLLSHGDGRLVTVYAHLGSVTPAIATGKTNIAAGERIGVVGHSGKTYGMHLFFEVLIDGRPIDPAPLLGLERCAAPNPPQPYRVRAPN
jgi:murein DD-endopeptidase MepM/ murein hydrolase activator NlpD